MFFASHQKASIVHGASKIIHLSGHNLKKLRINKTSCMKYFYICIGNLKNYQKSAKVYHPAASYLNEHGYHDPARPKHYFQSFDYR